MEQVVLVHLVPPADIARILGQALWVQHALLEHIVWPARQAAHTARLERAPLERLLPLPPARQQIQMPAFIILESAPVLGLEAVQYSILEQHLPPYQESHVQQGHDALKELQ